MLNERYKTFCWRFYLVFLCHQTSFATFKINNYVAIWLIIDHLQCRPISMIIGLDFWPSISFSLPFFYSIRIENPSKNRGLNLKILRNGSDSGLSVLVVALSTIHLRGKGIRRRADLKYPLTSNNILYISMRGSI